MFVLVTIRCLWIKQLMKMSHVCGMWLLEISPSCLCVRHAVCMCVYLALDVLRERIDVFGRPVGGSRWSILLFHLLLMEKRGARELTQTESSKGACQSHEMCVYVCVQSVYGVAVCFFHSAMIALGSSHSFFECFSSSFSCMEGNEDQG